MIKDNHIISLITLIIFTIWIISACQNTVSSDETLDTPSLPGFTYAFMNIEMFLNNTESSSRSETPAQIQSPSETSTYQESYFLNNRPSTGKSDGNILILPKSEFGNYLENNNGERPHFEIAQELIREVQLSLQTVQIVFNQLFMPASQQKPAISEEQFIWDYQMTVSETEEVIDIQLSAEQTDNDEYLWIMMTTGLDPTDSTKQLKVLEATCSYNGNIGYAKVSLPNVFGGDVFESDIEWDISNDMFTDMSLHFIYDGDDVNRIKTIATYNQDIESSIATITNAIVYIEDELDYEFESTWDIERNAGSITVDNEEMCWGEEFQNIQCE